jgi:hypothetical protein
MAKKGKIRRNRGISCKIRHRHAAEWVSSYRESIQIKGKEISRNLSTSHLNESMGLCTRMLRRNRVVLCVSN